MVSVRATEDMQPDLGDLPFFAVVTMYNASKVNRKSVAGNS
jgi:hypothetical protein